MYNVRLQERESAYLERVLKNLTPKSWRILLALDEGAGADFMSVTRQELARRLGQRRLYPHDDKLIRELAAAEVVYVYRERLLHYVMRTWGSNGFVSYNGRHPINMYGRFNTMTINPRCKPLLRKFKPKPAPVETAGFFESIGMYWQIAKDVLTRPKF
jgi:hypothetical protein